MVERLMIPEKIHYKGNTELKKKGVQIEFTPEQVSEIVKCYQNIKYFLANYVYIISLDKGKVLFNLYDFQEEMITEFQKNRFTIATLSRQMGKCLRKAINIRVRNKNTGDVYELPIGEFYEQRRIERNLSESYSKIEQI